MNKMKMLSAAIVAISVTLSGSVMAAAHAGKMNEADYNKARTNAVALADKADAVDGEWTSIRFKKNKEALIPTADKAAKKGDFSKAVALLKQAQEQALLGMQQAADQKNAGPRF